MMECRRSSVFGPSLPRTEAHYDARSLAMRLLSATPPGKDNAADAVPKDRQGQLLTSPTTTASAVLSLYPEALGAEVAFVLSR